MSDLRWIRIGAYACATIAALFVSSPAFAEDAERVTPKTIWDGTLTVNGLTKTA